MRVKSSVVTIIENDGDRRLCRPMPGDVRKDPTRCVIHNVVKENYPWAYNVSVGEKTIRLYDYRCEHNPAGTYGVCDECVGRRLEWATPLSAAEAIRSFDRGEDPIFPAFELRESEAIIVPAGQDKQRKRAAQKKYREEVIAGLRVPDRMSAKAKTRAKQNRRKG